MIFLGCLLVSALTTARSRIELVKTLHKLTNNGYIPLYTDTDSVLTVQVDKNAPPLEEVVSISNKIGDFKIEKSGIQSFIGLQSKLYAYRIGETLHCRAKGFSSVKTILEANERTDFFEEELKSFFLEEGGNSGQLFHQPRMQVKNHKVQDLPAEKANKLLRMRGPRRLFLRELVEQDSVITEVPIVPEDLDDEPKPLRINPERRFSVPLPCQSREIEALRQEEELEAQAKEAKTKRLLEKLDKLENKMKKTVKFPALIPTYPIGFHFDEELKLTAAEKLLGYDRYLNMQK